MASIFDSLKGLVTPELIAQAASSLGEDKSNVTKAVTSAVPSLLGSILAKGNDSGLESILKKAGSANDGILSNITSLFSGKSDDATSSLGSGLLESVLGSKLGGLTSLISSVSGISGGSSGKLLSMLSPIIGGFLGKKMSTDGLNLSGLLGLLNSEKSSFMNFIPSGLSGVLGLASLSSLGSNLTNKAKNLVEDVTDVAEEAKGGLGGLLKWLIPLAAALAIILFAWKSCSTSEVKQDVTNAAATAVDATKDAAASVASRLSVGFTLPDGVRIDAFEGGIESQLVGFLKSGTYKNASADELKGKWFNFDNINFEFGSSTKLTTESAKQIDNVVAIMKNYKDAKFKIGAYTDKKGESSTNLTISQERANTIKNILTEKGIGSQVIGAEGYGDQFAKVDASASDDDRAIDRKIAIRFEK